MNPTNDPSASPEQQPVGQTPEIPAAPVPVAPQGSTAPTNAPMPQLPVAPPIVQPEPTAPAPAPDPTSPAVAEDVDVIEKEWVDQANAVIKETEGDPFAQEEAVELLQIDYLQKRYGHTVGKPDDRA